MGQQKNVFQALKTAHQQEIEELKKNLEQEKQDQQKSAVSVFQKVLVSFSETTPRNNQRKLINGTLFPRA